MVEVPESKPVEQFQEKPGIAVVAMTLQCLSYPFPTEMPLRASS